MSNRAKIILLVSALMAATAGVFILVHIITGGAWMLSIPAALVAAAAVRPIYWRSIGRMTNNHAIVPTGHGSDGRIEAIEVFWRPG